MIPRSARGRYNFGKRQRGIVLVLVTIAMLAMLGIVGLALDGGHEMLNKTRLQNVVDAAALSAAKTLDQTEGDAALAQAEALGMFSANAAVNGNAEIQSSYAGGDLDISVQFSNTLVPFAPGTAPARYVRVRATNLRLPGWFIPVMGVDEKVVGASAIAGPSPTLEQICNIAPMMVCGDPAAAAAGDPFYGYEPGQPEVLKTSTSGGGNFQVGPGNFQLIRLDGMAGGADIRRAMAGDYNACLNLDETIPTEPGNTVGPVVQGLNTRLGSYAGPMGGKQSQYPPDVITKQVTPKLTYNSSTDTISYQGTPINSNGPQPFYDYEDYLTDVENGTYDNQPLDGNPPGIGAFGRRVLPVPVGDCSTTTNGQGNVPLMGVLCFHLLQEAEQKGNESHVYGQFIGEGCGVTGNPGPAPASGPGPYIIQLYKDPDWNSA
jgi:Flp pilus assembly protein TadG